MKWKDVSGYEGLYIVSDNGDIVSLDGYDLRGHLRKAKTLKQRKTECGYLQVGLYKEGKETKFLVHRIVASTFLTNQGNYTDINHIDENKTNNSVSNLEWCSRTYNCIYGTAQKRRIEIRKINSIYGLTGKSKKERNKLCVENF